MKKIVFLILFCTGLAHAQKPKDFADHKSRLTSYVDPFIGTDGFGHTYPGASMPFGMVQLSPDTRTSGWENCSGYHASDPTIIGFSHTHLSGTGAADYGDILFMASVGMHLQPGDETKPMSGYRSGYNHDTERARPGYYRVMLKDYNIQAEMTATTRCGFQKYTFPESDSAVVLIDLIHGISDRVTDAQIKIINDHTISGYRRSAGWAHDQVIYFYAEVSKPFLKSLITDQDRKEIKELTFKSEKGLRAFFTFHTKKNEAVYIKTGISTVDEDNAKKNMTAEIPGWDFKQVVIDGENNWEKELNKIVAEGASQNEMVNFYTALYHVMLSPNIMSDVDGRYRGMDKKIHTMEGGNMYTVFSLWDTFRALHPLYTIIDEKRAMEFVRALLQKYKESGLLPVWELGSNETNCMIGYHAVPVIADAYLKGLNDFDTTLAFEAMQKSANEDRLGLKFYKSRGYIPADKENESVSKTLEYAYDDWCISEVAKKMRKPDLYEKYKRRSESYLNVFDYQSGFMRGKKNGNWVTPFDPYDVSGIYTEANAWQYTWFVPHDLPGLINLMGGKDKMAAKLDTLFSAATAITGRDQPDISGMIGQYAHGNEPSHHIAYLYNYTSKPWRTAEITRKIMNDFYHNGRDGLIGNEDCGQMSAWYVLSAMGIYPVCPGNNTYVLGSPVFNKITINKDDGKTFIISADSNSATHIYISEALLNGKKTDGKINHQSIRNGGTLNLQMSATPSSAFLDNEKADVHKGLIDIPFIKSGEMAFIDSSKIEMFSNTEGAKINYTTDGTEPSKNSNKYAGPFYISKTTTIKIKAFKDGMEDSFTEEVNFIKLPYKMKITYTNPFSSLYTAGGQNGLLDGQHGETTSFGSWQGFPGDDFEAVIDLGTTRPFSSIKTTWLQQFPSWIWLPKDVAYFISSDGINFKKIYDETNDVSEHEEGSFTKTFEANVPGSEARFVKVKAKNIGICPTWHPGNGENAWLFIDEVEIK